MHNVTRNPYKGHDALTTSMASSFNGPANLVERMGGFSILASITGAPVGSLKLQASNNALLDNVNNDANPSAVWVDIPSSTVAVNGAASVMWNTTDVFYEAVRVVYTASSGTGVFTPYFMAKG